MYRVITTIKMPRGTARYYSVTPGVKEKIDGYKIAGKLILVRDISIDGDNVISAKYINDWENKDVFDEFTNWYSANHQAANDAYNAEKGITRDVEIVGEI